MQKIHVILRTCAIVNKASKNNSGRPFNLSKEKIILSTIKSLINSVKYYKERIYIDIVDDSSPDNFLDIINKLFIKSKLKFNLIKINVKNNGLSMDYCYNLAKKSKFDLIYFLEDDYFHLENSFSSIFDAYDSRIIGSNNFLLFPSDYPDRYIYLEPAYIYKGKYNYWRSVNKISGTFIIPKKLFLKYLKLFYKFADYNINSTGGEDLSLNKILEKEVCISPIYSLTAHLNTDTLPFFMDWKKEIDKFV